MHGGTRVSTSCHLLWRSLERMSHWVGTLRDACAPLCMPLPLSYPFVVFELDFRANMRLDFWRHWLFLLGEGIPTRCCWGRVTRPRGPQSLVAWHERSDDARPCVWGRTRLHIYLYWNFSERTAPVLIITLGDQQASVCVCVCGCMLRYQKFNLWPEGRGPSLQPCGASVLHVLADPSREPQQLGR